MVNELEPILQEAVTASDVPFVVIMIGNLNGVIWSGTAGERSPAVS